MKGDDPVFKFTVKYCQYCFNQPKLKKYKINEFIRVLLIIKNQMNLTKVLSLSNRLENSKKKK